MIGNRKLYMAGRNKSIMACVETPIHVLRTGNISTLAVTTAVQEIVCH